MKAIKLASIFAVSAVAAAVSTTTIAAEPVFSGTAGISYVTDGDSKDTASGTDAAEMELVVDTGVVYLEFEMGGDANSDETVNFGLEKAYVTQGAVQFGRFDGTLSDGGFMGVAENGSIDLVSNSDTDDTGIRYAISDELSVSIEATEANNVAAVNSEIGMALSYVADIGPGTFGISGGAVGEANAINFGYSMDVGGATVAVAYASGEEVDTDSKSSTYQSLLDVTSAAVSVVLAPTDATSISIEYASNTSEVQTTKVETDTDGLYVYASYAAGDLEYYVEHYGKDFGDSTEVGVTASF